MLAGTFLLPVPKPPCLAQASAAPREARNLTNAWIAGVSLNVTNRSPPISTAFAFGPDLTAGNGAALKPVFGFAFVDERMTPATKSPSNTIGPFGGSENAFVTESLNPFWIAPAEPPARLPLSEKIWLMSLSVAVTDGSVHLIVCALNWSYFVCPYDRR